METGEAEPLIQGRAQRASSQGPNWSTNHIPRIASVQCAHKPSCEQQFLERSRSSTIDEPLKSRDYHKGGVRGRIVPRQESHSGVLAGYN